MARVTIEDCLHSVENMYELVHLATKRVRMLTRGADPLVRSKNRTIVTALREIAAGKVLPRYARSDVPAPTSTGNTPTGSTGGSHLMPH